MRKERMRLKLEEVFKPNKIVIEDESGKHSRGGQETHFKCLIVSAQFVGKTRLERQKMVLDEFKNEFEGGLHALTLRCLTPQESLPEDEFKSPECASKSRRQ
jgi:BolA protein